MYVKWFYNYLDYEKEQKHFMYSYKTDVPSSVLKN